MTLAGVEFSFDAMKHQFGATHTLILVGIVSLIAYGLIAVCSFRVVQHGELQTGFVLAYIALAAGLGVLFLLFIWLAWRVDSSHRTILLIFAIGLAARGLMFLSTPVLEDDWNRYLWDGAVVANGIDPYAYAPAEAAAYDAFGNPLAFSPASELSQLQDIASAHALHHEQINYPHVKTIYPPLTQGAFAMAYVVSPFSLTSWRAVLLIIDIAAFCLCLAALAAIGKPLVWSAIYWWNPVVVLEGFNAGHMDILIAPCLFAMIYLACSDRRAWSVVALAIATAVKIWPVLLLPALLRPTLRSPIKLLGLGTLFTIIAGMLLLPQLLHLGDESQGLSVYAENWQRHAFLYSVLSDAVIIVGVPDPDRLARLLVALVIGGVAIWLALRSSLDGSGRINAMLWATVMLVLLSPTGYPWYLIWIAPLLPFIPKYGVAALIVTAPLYYTRFLLGDDAPFYQWGILPLAFGGPILLIVAEQLGWKRRHA